MPRDKRGGQGDEGSVHVGSFREAVRTGAPTTNGRASCPDSRSGQRNHVGARLQQGAPARPSGQEVGAQFADPLFHVVAAVLRVPQKRPGTSGALPHVAAVVGEEGGRDGRLRRPRMRALRVEFVQRGILVTGLPAAACRPCAAGSGPASPEPIPSRAPGSRHMQQACPDAPADEQVLRMGVPLHL